MLTKFPKHSPRTGTIEHKDAKRAHNQTGYFEAINLIVKKKKALQKDNDRMDIMQGC
jgi:hypothetical protein